MKHRFSALFLGGLIVLSASLSCGAAIKGDVDLDGQITGTDAAAALQYALIGEKTGYTAEQVLAADFDEDGIITATDANFILQKALTPEFDIEKKPVNPDTSDGVVVSDFGALNNALANGEKKIYISGTISCSAPLALNTASAGVEFYGLTNEDGTGAALDFAVQRDKCTKSGESCTGIFIKGSGYSFRNLIIENAGDCGVRIKGETAGDCLFENCVFRYNNNSGVSVTAGAHDNRFISCDSYRNGDIVQKNGSDADGFSVKLLAGKGNYFYNCRAWENSDDGWDSYQHSEDVTYIECLTWHNGDNEVFTGEYDYKAGYPLDKKLIYVQAVLANDPDFEAKYNAKQITEWPDVTVRLLGTENNYTNMYEWWNGNPNGFKFGPGDDNSYRYIENCISFDHFSNSTTYKAKGFDQNSGRSHYDMKNILAFNNVVNVQMKNMTADSIEGVVWGFDKCISSLGSLLADEPSSGMTVKEPENKDDIRKKVYAYRDNIYNYVYNDKIPGKQICDVFPKQ